MLLELKDVTKKYGDHIILDHINLSIQSGETIAITGASGCGKSTLLHIAGLFIPIDSGNILINNSIVKYKDTQYITTLRQNFFGIVYQQHYLLDDFSVLDNIIIPQLITGKTQESAQYNAEAILDELNILDKANMYPQVLSGGEQQRVSIARAVINNPKVILTDEPTGNLDSKNGKDVCNLLLRMSTKYNAALIMITHDLNIANQMQTTYTIQNHHLTLK